jgi:hypothetical protein
MRWVGANLDKVGESWLTRNAKTPNRRALELPFLVILEFLHEEHRVKIPCIVDVN